MIRAGLPELTAFVAIAEQRSFSGAARTLGVSPSALSHSMRGLEARLELRLLP
jgi:DNA-binding transcriptional LysR family regulator